MKCKIFVGTWYEAQDAFNYWAKGKALSRDVLIHELVLRLRPIDNDAIIAIIVYHPEDPQWDTTPQKPAIPIQNIPVPKYHLEEAKVTQ
jgi:hypothetical protein